MKTTKISSPLPHFNERPTGTTVDTLIIHSISAGANCSAKSCIDLLDQHKVAAHYLIDRDGRLYQTVDEKERAWHAGDSMLPFADDPRTVVNDFSIGIELITPPDNSFTEEQYQTLSDLTHDIASRHTLKYILGHEHISPGRKTDPGINFDWDKFRNLCAELKIKIGA